MLTSFYSDSWSKCSERDYFRRILKLLRYHKATERLDKPTTQLIFFSNDDDFQFRHYFEESSRHFKTYNTSYDLFEAFYSFDKIEAGFNPILLFLIKVLHKIYSFPLLRHVLTPFLGEKLIKHFTFISVLQKTTLEQAAKMILTSFKTLGVLEFSPLNVFTIQTNNLNCQYFVQYLCKSLNNFKLRTILGKEGFSIPRNTQFASLLFDKSINKFTYLYKDQTQDADKLYSCLNRKIDWVQNRISTKTAINSQIEDRRVLVFGGRYLTRGSTLNSNNIFLQSYDYSKDDKLVFLKRLFRIHLVEHASTKVIDTLVVVEHKPNALSSLISGDDEFKSFMNAHNLAIACIHPETKDIFLLEGTQFIQQLLRQVY